MCLLQEAVKESKAALLTPEDGDEVSRIYFFFILKMTIFYLIQLDPRITPVLRSCIFWAGAGEPNFPDFYFLQPVIMLLRL